MSKDFIDIEKADAITVPSILPEVNGCILDLRNLKVKCENDVECENCLYSYETYRFIKGRIKLNKIDIERAEAALEAFKKSGKKTMTMEELRDELELNE